MVNSPRRPGTLYVFSGQGMYRSQDGAQTWTNLRPPINPFGPPPQIIAIDPKTPSTIYIAGAYSNTPQQAFILKSLDSGTTWRVLSNLPVLALTVDPADSNALFAASINGSVYSSSNGGISWNPTSLTNITLDALAFDPYTPTNLYAVADQGLYVYPPITAQPGTPPPPLPGAISAISTSPPPLSSLAPTPASMPSSPK